MKSPSAEPTVESYLAKQAPAVRSVLERVRSLIKKLLPDAEERISYQIPSYRLDGVTVVFFAGWKEHYALYPVNEDVIRALGEDPSTFVLSKGTIRLRYDARFPEKLLRAIVLEKKKTASEIAATRKARKASKKAAKKVVKKAPTKPAAKTTKKGRTSASPPTTASKKKAKKASRKPAERTAKKAAKK